MKGEKISQITTDIGTIVAVVTFFGCMGYVLYDLRVIMLDGWSGVWLRACGIGIMIFCGYVPYWFMSIFYRHMYYPFLGFGGCVGFAIGDLSMRIFAPIVGVFNESGYMIFGGNILIFSVIFVLLVIGDRIIVQLMRHRKRTRSYMMYVRNGMEALINRRIL